MSTSSVIVLCAVVFCAAVVLTSILNRPVVVVQPSRENEGSGCLMGMGALLLVAGFVIWLLWPSSQAETDDRPEAPRAEQQQPDKAPADTQTPAKNAPNPPEQAPHVNKPRGFNVNAQNLVQYDQNTGDEGYVPETPDRREKKEPRWVVLLKCFQTLEKAERLPLHFPSRNISVVKMSNGEYWAVIEMDSKKEAKDEVDDWYRPRNRDDWEHLEIQPKVKDLNNL